MCDAVPEGGTSRYPGSLRRFVVHRSSHLTLGVHLAGRGQHGEGKQFLILCPDQSPPASVKDLLSYLFLFCFFFSLIEKKKPVLFPGDNLSEELRSLGEKARCELAFPGMQ